MTDQYEETDTRPTLKEAMNGLTMGEIESIERHYGAHWGGDGAEGVSPMLLTAGTFWAHRRRVDLATNAEKLTSWADVNATPLRDVEGWFAPAEIEPDPANPETPSGKETSPAAE